MIVYAIPVGSDPAVIRTAVMAAIFLFAGKVMGRAASDHRAIGRGWELERLDITRYLSAYQANAAPAGSAAPEVIDRYLSSYLTLAGS